MVAAVKIAPGELAGSERAALVGMAEATPKGQRRSRATQEEIMLVAGLKSRNGIDKVVKGLVDHGLIRHERARFRHVAAYFLLFDEWVYDEEAREMRPPQVTQPTGNNHEVGSPTGDPTDELRHPQGKVASPGGDVSPSTPEKLPLSSAGPAAPVPAPRTDGNGQSEREDLIEWIKERHRPGGKQIEKPRAYLARVEANGDYPDLLAAMHTDRAQQANQPPPRPPLPEWCEKCGVDTGNHPDHVRANPRLRYLGGRRCPNCHPDLVGEGC